MVDGGIEVDHRWCATLRRRGGPTSRRARASVHPVDLACRGPVPTPEDTAASPPPDPDWMAQRALPAGLEARPARAGARQVQAQLGRAVHRSERQQHLASAPAPTPAASLLELSTSGLRTSVLVRSWPGETRWIDLELRGAPGTPPSSQRRPLTG
jgi:hypothetical protein